MRHRIWIGKYIGKMLGLSVGILVFIGIAGLLNKMYKTDNDAHYRILWHHFYEDEGKIDNLYMGSSHVYYALDPRILDELTGEYNFNLASPSQPLNGSYYLLREAEQRNDLSHVYLEMYYLSTANDDRLLMYQRNWSNTDYMKMSINKIAYMRSIGGMNRFVNVILPFSRYRKYLGDWDYVKEGLNEKKEEQDYYSEPYEIENRGEGEREVIYGQGFRESTIVFKEYQKLYKQNEDLSEFFISEKNEKYCRMIIEYCQRKGLPITLFASPMTDLRLIGTTDYDKYVNEIRKLAREYGVAFYDFNLAREEYLPLQDSSFRDDHHLNKCGAEVFTPFFYKVVSGGEADYSTYFYDSYKDKLNALAPVIYGICYSDSADGVHSMWVASNRDTGMEYKIVLKPDEGEPYTVQDFKENKEFQTPSEEHGICTLVARMKDSPEEERKMEINY